MTYAVFYLGGQFAESLVVAFGDEDGIVSETAFTVLFRRYPSAYYPTNH